MIILMIVTLLSNLWLLAQRLIDPYNSNMWFYAYGINNFDIENIFAFAFMILFYASIIPIIGSIVSTIRKGSTGFWISIVLSFIFQISLIVFHSAFNALSLFQLILVGVNLFLTFGILVLVVFRKRHIEDAEVKEESVTETNLKATRIPFAVLITVVLSLVVFLSTFVVPLYSITTTSTYSAILANVLFSGEQNFEIIVFFIIYFGLFLIALLYFANVISMYFYDKESFIEHSRAIVTYIFTVTLLFFVSGMTFKVYYNMNGTETSTLAYIPIVLMVIILFIFSIYIGKFNELMERKLVKSSIKFPRIEPLIYVYLSAGLTVLLLFLNIIKITVVAGTYSTHVYLSGLEILQDYASLDPAYRYIAFALVVMLIVAGLSIVIATSSYLGKYKNFGHIVKVATSANTSFIFMLSVAGYYFQIGQQINQAMIVNILAFYGFSLPSSIADYSIIIRSDAIYALIASSILVSIMFLRKSFDREELLRLDMLSAPQIETPEEDGEETKEVTTSNQIDDDIYFNFDPCPGFTEIDELGDTYIKDVEERKTYLTEENTLHDLIHFIVEYARNSRLHLSYTEADIATFVAGLGSSKLSILQGMSGTGKTSLPKIFSEAILGNCEIIEVESSWKDKNELLGYYNEFSMKYTPKKFTLALYKAALNPEIFTFVLLDEMNLSRIEYYFSDFLSLMENEPEDRKLKLINLKLSRKVEGEEVEYSALSSGHTLNIPPNVWFIGTANRDESTFVISDKVYDRATTMNFTKRAPKVRDYKDPISKEFYTYEHIETMLEKARKEGTFDAENNEIIKQIEVLLAPYNISFGNRILKQIEEFVNIYKACFADKDVESEAVEKILLSKVVTKLEVKTIDEPEALEMAFEKLNLHQCVQFIRSLDNE